MAFYLIFIVAGIFAVGAGVLNALPLRIRRRRAVQVEGVIIRHRTRTRWSDNRMSQTHYPVVEFTTRYGETIQAEAQEGCSLRAGEEGDSIDVYYDPHDPRKFFGETEITRLCRYAVSGFMIIFGIVVLWMFSSAL